jgi:chemotaxis protein MotA
MYSIIGILIVFGAVAGGYLLEKGNLLVLLQPAELLIIGGAAVGTVLVANPLHVLSKILKGVGGVFKESEFTRKRYLDSLKMLHDLFNQARRGGLPAIETDIEEPQKSKLFAAFPFIMKDSHVRGFICDTLRLATTGAVDPFDIDQIMELDLEARRHETGQPVSALSTMADSLPGLGIVAAVLGVVITMGAMGGAPDEIGHKVAAALVGTFLGILLCYGLVGPIASKMAHEVDEERGYYHVLRVSMTAFIKGMPPILAVETGRRAIPGRLRPTFQELERVCRGKAEVKEAAANAA